MWWEVLQKEVVIVAVVVPTDVYINERLDHLGIVAGVCQEFGLAAWLDAQDPGNRQQVSVGTATVAMVLNGLGFSNRQLYLVPQYFANKPVEHLLGAGITAERRECRLFGAHPGLVVRARSHQAVCRDCQPRTPDPWDQGRAGARRHHLVFREWRVCWCGFQRDGTRQGRRAGRTRGSPHRHHLWLFARPPRRSQAMD